MFNKSSRNTIYSFVTNFGIRSISYLSCMLYMCYLLLIVISIKEGTGQYLLAALPVFLVITFCSIFNVILQMKLDSYDLVISRIDSVIFTVVMIVVYLVSIFMKSVTTLPEALLRFQLMVAFFYAFSMCSQINVYVKTVDYVFSIVAILVIIEVGLLIFFCVMQYNFANALFLLVVGFSAIEVLITVGRCALGSIRKGK